MSNTDGEDIQRIEGFNPGDKAYILTEEQYIKFEKQNDVIADLKFKLKNDAIFQEYSDLEKELASLREQLERAKYALSIMEGNRDRLFDQLKQKEDKNRELKASIAVLLDELMYESTTGDFWMWARSNEKVPDRIMKIRNDNLSA